jgi:peptidylprolyl isomerase
MKILSFLMAFLLIPLFVCSTPSFATETKAAPAMTTTASTTPDLENTLYLDVPTGRVVIELFPDVAPKHVEQIKTLTRKGFYNGIVFHRVIEGFMAQTGDPTGTGTGGSDLPNIPAEFNNKNFGRGAVGMARSASPNSGNSQFFICFDDCGFLNGQYTVWGQVTSGMEFVDQIKRGEPPANPDKIVKMQVAADEKAEAPKAAAQ